VAERTSPQDALADACAQAGLDASGASVLYDRSSTVYRLAGRPVVVRLRYVHGSGAWRARLATSVQITGWLHEQGFPAVRPLNLPQPVEAHGYLITFWHYISASGPPWEDVESLGRLLRRLHELGDPPAELPPARPLSSLREDAERCSWLTAEQQSWVLGRADELTRQYDETTWALGCGMIHGDAYADNVLQTPDGPVLADWDSVSRGPREQDVVPTSIRHRFGRPVGEWRQFCAAYGVDPDDLPGLDVLRQMRELRALVPYIRSSGKPAATAEGSRRIADLMSGTQSEPWRALNLAS
jgi:hypothetical protein